MRIAFISIVTASFLYSADPTAASKGANIANTALSVFGSKEGVNNRLSQPLMSTSQMTTVDGSKSFNAQMQCPASSKSVGITFIPNGGNEYRLIVKQDTDLNGAFDYTYDTSTLGRSVSGVCTNGVIMCNPTGSWTSCKTYVWDASHTGQISLHNVINGSYEVGACFCSNSSCGISSLAPQIYENIGGGISAAIMKNNPLFLHSKSDWNFLEMTYYLYGQNKTNCTGLGSSNWDKYGEKNPTSYYNVQTPPNTSIADVAVDQGSDPTSYYSLLSHQNEVSYNASGDIIGMPETVQCVIKTLPVITTEKVTTNIGTYKTNYWKCDSCNWGFDIKTQPIGSSNAPNDHIYPVNNSTYLSIYGAFIGAAKASYATYWSIDTDTSVPCEPNSCTAFLGYFFRHDGKSPIQITSNGAHKPTYTWTTQEYQDIKTDTIALSESSTCPISSDDCKIKQESICDDEGKDCINTILNGSKTSEETINRCINYSSEIKNYIICESSNALNFKSSSDENKLNSIYSGKFFTKRTYDCGISELPIDSSKMTRAAGTAYKTDQSATSMTYTDHEGSVKTVNKLPTGDECPTPVCTIKRISKSTDQFSDGTNREQTKSGSEVTETVIKTCLNSGASMICPTEAGDIIIEECSCTGNWAGFQQTVTTLGAVSEATKDMICSQN